MCTDTRGDCASPRLARSRFCGGRPWRRGRGHPPSPRSSPGEGAQPCSRSAESRAGGRRRAGAQGQPRELRAGSAAAGGSARPRAGREAADAPCYAAKCARACKPARVWGFFFFFPSCFLSAAPSSWSPETQAGRQPDMPPASPHTHP